MPDRPIKIHGEATASCQLLPNAGQSTGVNLDFDGSVQVQSVAIDESINTWKKVVITFRAPSPEYVWAKLSKFFSTSPVPAVKLRYGLSAASTGTWRAWEQYYLVSITPDTAADRQSGPLVAMTLVDRLYLSQALCQVKLHKGQVSSVVASLWADVGGTDTVIEPTALAGLGASDGTWYQLYDDNFELLTSRLMPVASNAAGIGGYRVFVRDGALRFHTPAYGTKDRVTVDYSSGSPTITDLVVFDTSVERIAAGSAARTVLARHDPLSGQSDFVESTSGRKVSLATTRPKFLSTVYFGKHTGQNLAAASDAWNQYQYAANADEIYRAEFTSSNSISIQVGDVINLSILSGMVPAAHSGSWHVNRVIHLITNGALTSRYVAVRGELASSQTGVSSTDTPVPTPPIGYSQVGRQSIQAPVYSSEGVTVPILPP